MAKFRKNFTIVDLVNHRNRVSENHKKELSLLAKNIDKIKKHSLTKEIHYPKFKESYDYVDKFFPNINIKEVITYKVNSKFLEKIGYQGVGGFYDKIYKNVVFSSSILPGTRLRKLCKGSIVAKITDDEVLTHELIHYCYFEKNIGNSVDIQEEFAYGWSYGYLNAKGYSDDKIIDNNYLPYLFNVAKKSVFEMILARDSLTTQWNDFSSQKKNRVYKKYNKEIHKRSLEMARERGRQIIKIYCEKCNQKVEKNLNKEKMDRFNLMDI